MALLTKEQILGADDLGSEIVAVPEWGGDVRVVGLTGAGRDRIEAQLVDDKGNRRPGALETWKLKIVVSSIVDEGGERLFSEAELSELSQKSAAALNRVADAPFG